MSFRHAVAALAVLSLTAACTGGSKPASDNRGMEAPAATSPAEPSTSTTAFAASALVLSPDGLGPLTFGTQAARAMDALTQAFGRAENITVIPPESKCGATRMFRWRDFAVLINEVTARSGGAPGLVGWSLGAAPPGSADLRTDKGVGIGSTAAAVKAAYGPAATQSGPIVTVTVPNGVMTAELDGAGRVKTLRAGVSCSL